MLAFSKHHRIRRLVLISARMCIPATLDNRSKRLWVKRMASSQVINFFETQVKDIVSTAKVPHTDKSVAHLKDQPSESIVEQ